MTYYSESVTTGAAANRRTARKDPMELLVRLRTQNHNASFENILAKWKKAIHADDEYEEAVDMYCFRNLWTELDAAERRKQQKEAREAADRAAKARGEPTAEETRAAETNAAADAVRQTILWDFLMPNGKPLHACTFGYALTAGGIFTRIGKMGKKTEIIGNKLKREQIEKISERIRF